LLGPEVFVQETGETISAGQFHAMRALADRDRTAGELARAIIITLPSLTQLVDGLVERKLVERYADPTDRRKVRLALTPEGRALYAHAREAAEQRVATILAVLPSDEERDAVLRGFEAMREAINATARVTR
jgi:DNA-binding MarR family transcriptional regulator